ncbi:hypothetical protein AB0I41_35045, partial [Micromonospora sp. NPDC050200]
MSCSILIGAPASGGAYTARLLHTGGDPEQMLPLLRRIWQHTFTRHTLALTSALLRHDWTRLHPAAPRPGRVDRERPVAGVGYTADLQDGVRRGLTSAPVEGYLEWMYLVDVATDTVAVYEATRHARWLRHSRHLLDPDSCGRVLGCGGYTADGHRWDQAHLWLPEARAGLDAEICLGRHPNAARVLRFADATAHAVRAATAPMPERAGRREPWLRQVGIEFDLVWPHGRGPHRLRRDADGLLLLDVDVPDWSWWLLPTPS